MVGQAGKMTFWTRKPCKIGLFSNVIKWWKFRLKLVHGLTANSNSPKLRNHDSSLIWKQANIFEPFPFSLQASKFIEALIMLIWLVKALCSYFTWALVIGPSECSYTLESTPFMLESWCISYSDLCFNGHTHTISWIRSFWICLLG